MQGKRGAACCCIPFFLPSGLESCAVRATWLQHESQPCCNTMLEFMLQHPCNTMLEIMLNMAAIACCNTLKHKFSTWLQQKERKKERKIIKGLKILKFQRKWQKFPRLGA